MFVRGSIALVGLFLVTVAHGYFHNANPDHQYEPQLKVSGLKRYEQATSGSFRIEFILADFHDTERRYPVSGKLCGNSSVVGCIRPEFYASIDTRKPHAAPSHAFSGDQTRSDVEYRLKKGLSEGPIRLRHKSNHNLCTSDLELNQPVNIRVHVLDKGFQKPVPAFIEEFICLLPGFLWHNDDLVLERTPSSHRLAQKLNCLAVHRPGKTRLTYRWTAFPNQDPACKPL
ncbi:hypothetical protein RvY_16378 [Ramazzottius varieornatus]|uniref:Secreted protein n=1 Tax=Ramazzottius varieornatus TaxID=947166 RepID=A0A1D1W5U6_RAMVA|nr:hypothetical protein RvY_16378 [Ramazzottius varieornatus]